MRSQLRYATAKHSRWVLLQISRAPDVVLYPHSHEEVEKIVALASKHLVDIVPYGGAYLQRYNRMQVVYKFLPDRWH